MVFVANNMPKNKEKFLLGRRNFMQSAGAMTVVAMAGTLPRKAGAQAPWAGVHVDGRRQLGALEVSSVGLGCQDMTGTFYATAPRRL